MRSPRILAAGCLVALACLSLSGCVAEARDGPTGVATPTATGTSPFASNDEALAAVTKTYQRYIDISNDLANDTSSDPERLREVELKDLADDEIAAVLQTRASGETRSGAATFDTVRYEYASVDDAGLTHVSTFLCVDLSQTSVRAADGSDVTPMSGDRRIELHVRFVTVDAASKSLMIERSELWAHEGAC